MPEELPSLNFFGPAHLTLILLSLLGPVIFAAVFLWRRAPDDPVWIQRDRLMRWALAVLLALSMVGKLIYFGLVWQLPATQLLPMHLCDWALFIGIAALIWRQQDLYELTYFWGLSGTMQAMLTPHLGIGFPHPAFFFFMISHGGVVFAALYLTIGSRLRPRAWWKSVGNAMLWLAIYAGVAYFVNIIINANYGYVRYKPPVDHPIVNALGAWPWYVGQLGLFALAFFTLLYAPFFFLKKRLFTT